VGHNENPNILKGVSMTMKQSRKVAKVWAVVAAGLLFAAGAAASAFAQSAGSITGTVKDSNNCIVSKIRGGVSLTGPGLSRKSGAEKSGLAG
jgi:hypothetical protein